MGSTTAKESDEESDDEENQESIVTGYDQRKPIYNSYCKDEPIIDCIGQLIIYYRENDGYSITTIGTGTVFKTKGDKVFIITAAHNVRKSVKYCTNCKKHRVSKHIKYDKKGKKPRCNNCNQRLLKKNEKYIRAKRIEFSRNSIKKHPVYVGNDIYHFGDVIKCYNVVKCEYIGCGKLSGPERNSLNGYQNYMKCDGGYDLAILSFVDNTRYYVNKCKNIDIENGAKTIEWIKKKGVEFNIFGYPGDKVKKEEDKKEEDKVYKMYGMASVGTDFYVKEAKVSNEKYLQQKVIDTSFGESGAALWVKDTDNDKIIIFGVHTGGGPKNDESASNVATLLSEYATERINKMLTSETDEDKPNTQMLYEKDVTKFPRHLLNVYTPNVPNEQQQQHGDSSSPSNPLSNRKRANANDYKEDESYIHSIGCLHSQYDMIEKDGLDHEEMAFVGTATILKTGSDNLYLLTCAHNVLKRNEWSDDWVQAKSILFELRKNTTFLFQKKSELIKNKRFAAKVIWIHPEYKTNSGSKDGYDIAILKCIALEDYLDVFETEEIKTMDMFEMLTIQIEQYKENREKGCECDYEEKKYTDAVTGCIVGFPAEYDGQLYGMMGKIYNIPQNDKILQYDRIATSGGQSGSPILSGHINDSVYRGKKKIIGVHTGGRGGTNWGTKITKEIYDEIEARVKKNDCNELRIDGDKLIYGDHQWVINFKAIKNNLKMLSPTDSSQAFAQLINYIDLIE